MRAAFAAARCSLALVGAGAPVDRRDDALVVAGERLRAFTYVPKGRSEGATVLAIHGLSVRGIDDPRFDAVCRGLAASGARVVAVELPGVVRLRVEVADIARIAGCVQALAGARPIGVFSVSFPANLCLHAAARCGDAVAAMCLVGPCRDPRTTIEYAMRTGEPDPFVRLVVLRNFSPAVAGWSPALVAALDAWLRDDCLREQAPRYPAARAALAADERALIDDLVAGGPRAREVVSEMLDRGGDHLATFTTTAIAPGIRAPITLFHGADDPVIPSSESVALAAMLARARLCVTPLLTHGDTAFGPRTLLHVPPLLAALRGFFADLRGA